MGFLSPNKEKSKKEAELSSPSEDVSSSSADVAATSTSATSDAAPSVTTEIPAGSLINATTPVETVESEEVAATSAPVVKEAEKKEETPVVGTAPSAVSSTPVVAGESPLHAFYRV